MKTTKRTSSLTRASRLQLETIEMLRRQRGWAPKRLRDLVNEMFRRSVDTLSYAEADALIQHFSDPEAAR